MSKEKIKTIKIFMESEIKAELVKGILEDNGIKSLVNTKLSDAYLGLSCDTELIINEKDFANALKVIKEFEDEIPPYKN